ncbi:MAG: glycosyltransferase family 39 protein [Pelagibacteraceae bacterium]|jgi:4-amino-4-deoxy-L-arabinose transferase-like glycosyltransferase|nr:glycosyltransferase family 39 protein [Pelagibacteraceae bacterium]
MKKNIHNIFNLFLVSHIVIWTLVPFFSNPNLPLDTIEALAWGSNLDWGYDKHPPLSAFFPEIVYQIFGNQDWAYYLLSQIFIIASFIVIFKLAKEFLKNETYALLSIFLLEGIYFYNFTTPEFNVNICQIPFWSLTTYYAWQSFKDDKVHNWILFGLFAALGVLSKYLFIYLLISINFFFIYYLLKNKKFNYKCLIPVAVFFLVISPHFIWLIENDYKTIAYGLKRTGLEQSIFSNHLIYPLKFIFKQIGILIPFFILLSLILKKYKFKINYLDKKSNFLIFITLMPIFLMILTSLIFSANIRTMWMTPFYLFFGLFFIYHLRSNINLNYLKRFLISFLLIFFLSPAVYLYVSFSKDNKRTDYPGKEIAELVQNRWNKNFTNNITIVVGDEWVGGNLSYHLQSRPKWLNNLNPKLKDLKIDGGVIYVGNKDILKSVCPGDFGSIKLQGICMIGVR